MEVFYDLIQGTPEWKKHRYTKIGGSSAKDLLVANLKDSALFFQIVSEMSEDFDEYEDSYVNADMQRGNDLEPYAREELEILKGLSFIVPGWIQSDIPILGISPDGVTENFKIASEFKCPTKKTYAKYLANNMRLVEDHAPQIADYFATIEGIELLYMCAYRPENRFRKIIIVEVTRETMFNNGTEKTPKMYTIGELANDIRVKAPELEKLCKEQVESYKF